ncbi:MAG: hypothetical protein CM15mP102_11420 [Flavobacteriales bacterium]|nr:MAG: hypothetical protein CM15mP102_11420 [Flavobacteriales bacterium]
MWRKRKALFLDLFDIFFKKNNLGVNYSKSNSDNDSILEILLGLRDKARANKDFELSDSIRDQLFKIRDKNK